MLRLRSRAGTAALLAALIGVTSGRLAAADDPYYVVPCRDVSWAELCAVFDPAWILPASRRPDRAPDLVQRVKRLAAARWESDDERFRSLGDLIAASDALGRRPELRLALLDRFRRDQPAAWAASGELIAQVLTDDSLRPSRWDPDDDADDDGLFIDVPWSLEGRSELPWRSLEGNRDVHQATAFVRADLQAIKNAENDYATYPGYAGAEYEAIYPVPERHVRAAPDEASQPQVALQLAFRVDLPFPFSSYSCLLRILNRVDDDGHLVTDIYSTSEDFYWMAGRDVFVPVTTSSGEFVGMLVARWFGFDIQDVPDGTDARRTGLRAGLGRLKLRAERAYASASGGPTTVSGCVPVFVVRGDRRWRR